MFQIKLNYQILIKFIKILMMIVLLSEISACNSGNKLSDNISAPQLTNSDINLKNAERAKSRIQSLDTADTPTPEIGIFDPAGNMVSFCHQDNFPIKPSDCYFSALLPESMSADIKLNSVNGQTYLYYTANLTGQNKIKMCQVDSVRKSFDPSQCVSAFSDTTFSALSNYSAREIVFNDNFAYIVINKGVVVCSVINNGKLDNCNLSFAAPVGEVSVQIVFDGQTAFIATENGVRSCLVDNSGNLGKCVNSPIQALPTFDFNNSNSYSSEMSIFGNTLFIAIYIESEGMPNNYKSGLSLAACQLLPTSNGLSFNTESCQKIPWPIDPSYTYNYFGVVVDNMVISTIASDGAVLEISGRRTSHPGGGFYVRCIIGVAGAYNCSNSYNYDHNFPEYHYISLLPMLNSQLAILKAGRNVSCGLSNSKSLYCLGSGIDGMLGNNITESFESVPEFISKTEQSITPILIDNKYFDGAVHQVGVGDRHICATTQKSDSKNSLYCWGNNIYSQVGQDGSNYLFSTPQKADLPLGVTDIDDIAIGGSHNCFISEGNVYCFGLNDHGQLGIENFENQAVPQQIKGVSVKFASISLGFKHSCGIDQSGKAYCWGLNSDGQLGSGDTNDSNYPIPVGDGSIKWNSISAGVNHTCGLSQGGNAYCWGGNENGQLGDGTQINRLNPVPVVKSGSKFAMIASGFNFSCGLTENNDVYCWGFGGLGQIGDGTTNAVNLTPNNRVIFPNLDNDPVTNIELGDDYACGVTRSNKVYCWGSNAHSQLGDVGNSNEFSSRPTNPIIIQNNDIGYNYITPIEVNLFIKGLIGAIADSLCISKSNNPKPSTSLSAQFNPMHYIVTVPTAHSRNDPEYDDGMLLPAFWANFIGAPFPDIPDDATEEQAFELLGVAFNAAGGVQNFVAQANNAGMNSDDFLNRLTIYNMHHENTPVRILNLMGHRQNPTPPPTPGPFGGGCGGGFLIDRVLSN